MTTRLARYKARGPRHPSTCDDRGVSDIVGTMLLVGITVMSVGIFSLYLGTLDGPSSPVDTDLETVATAGTGGWGTGDERVIVRHLGGEPLDRTEVKISITIGDQTKTYSGNLLDGDFADGSLTIGDAWSATMTLAETDETTVSVVLDRGFNSQLLLNESPRLIPTMAMLPALLAIPSKRQTVEATP